MARQTSRWLANRDAIARSQESRQFVNDILAELAAHRFGPSAWASFIGRSLVRSVDPRSTAVISVAYFARGRAIDYPRPIAVRYLSGITQILFALRKPRSVAR
jgi:hypothetical protein